MKKRIISISIVLIMLLSFALTASAHSSHIFDFSDNLEEYEMSELDTYAMNIENKYGYCVMFCIVDGVSNYDSTYDYAEDLYTSQKDTENGILIVDNLGDNVYAVYLSGDAETVFTEADQDVVWNAYNAAETYYGGIIDYYNAVEKVLSGNGVVNNNTAETTTKTESVSEFEGVERILPLVVDYADLLTDEQEKEFIEKFNTFTEKYEMEIAFVTVTSLEGKTAQEYADDFYDYNGYGYGENDDGFLLLYLPGEEGERELYLTTHGKAIYKMSDDMITTMLLGMKDYLISGDYNSALDSYIETATEYVKPGVSFIWLFVMILVASVIVLFILNGMASANKSVYKAADAKVYVRGGSMVIMNSADNFVRTYVHQESKNTDSDSDSDSSTHTSSSGRTHGGGGIKF